jgi:hypothetical protein
MRRIDLESARRLVLKHLSLAFEHPEAAIGLQKLESQVSDAWWKEQGGSDRSAAPSQAGLGVVHKVHEIVWDLIAQRVLTLSTLKSEGLVARAGEWSYLRLTAYGAEVIREQRWSPYDPDGYSGELHKQAPALASLCHMYAKEALQCFRSGCYLAAVVMLGAASEGIVIELFRRFVAALKAGRVSEGASVEAKIEKEQSVYRKYEVFRKYFDSLVEPKLPPELGDDLNLQFDGVFNLIRFYRNDAGHPTGTRIERMSAFTSLVLFVPYCKRVEDLVSWLQANSGSLNT